VQTDDIHLLDHVRLSLATSTERSTDQLIDAVLPAHRLTRREGGKPDLWDAEGRLRPISITHTAGFSAVCWGDAGHIGIDAERADRQVHPGLMARMRHPDDDIRLLDDAIGAWIIKESVLKCIGTGLRLAMNKIAVRFTESDRFIALWNGHAFHGILLTRHDIRLSIVHTSSPL
jgi:phosphopantetheinyl transferase